MQFSNLENKCPNNRHIIYVRQIICEDWHFTHTWKTTCIHDRVVLFKVDVWENKTTLTPLVFIEVRGYEKVCLGISILPFSTIFLLHFRTVTMVLYRFVVDIIIFKLHKHEIVAFFFLCH